MNTFRGLPRRAGFGVTWMGKRDAEVPMETSDDAAIMLLDWSEISDLRGSKWV